MVGTTSIEKSELLSDMLKKEKVKHNVLNARQHEQEAQIVGDAGKLNAVTIATNMAGRGTDIQLGGNVEMKVLEALAKNPNEDPEKLRSQIEASHSGERDKVLAAGGLFVLATERHESRRIDNQLRGRSGRQGDAGRSSFFLSLEDDLMRIFGSERLDKVLSTLGMEEGEAIVHPWVNKSLERAQAKVEGRNFDIRKQLLKFDDVMNDQRKAIFEQRLEILNSTEIGEIVEDMREEVLDDAVETYMPAKAYAEQWETEDLETYVKDIFNVNLPIVEWADEDGVDNEIIRDRISNSVDEFMDEKAKVFGAENMSKICKQILLQTIDRKWREHLLKLEHLRSVVSFRGYAQRDPLNEYKNEAFQLFESLLGSLRLDVTKYMGQVRPLTEEEQKAIVQQVASQQQPSNQSEQTKENGLAVTRGPEKEMPKNWHNTGRNEKCPCGSGKKFKHCHGRLI